MTPRLKIERMIAIALLCAFVGSLAYSAFEQKREMGVFMSIGGPVFLFLVIRRIVSREAKAALWMGVLASTWAAGNAVLFFSGFYRHEGAGYIKLAVFETAILVFACCSFDMWAEWRRPNNSPEATPGQRRPISPGLSSGAPHL